MKQDERLLEKIADDIHSQGWCVIREALPSKLAISLSVRAKQLNESEYIKAGVGRGHNHLYDNKVRQDEIYWIDESLESEDNTVEDLWLSWLNNLRQYLNQNLFLGLFSVESHFAHYPPDGYYQKHCDAFRGQSNRKLSLVTYLNDNWNVRDGGELKLYQDLELSDGTEVIKKVLPELGTLVIFLSERFPHEVLPALRNRYSIASWFRVNTSI